MSPAEEASVRLRRLVRDVEADLRAMDERASEIAKVTAEAGDGAVAARLAVALHHYYTAFESLIERAVRFHDGDLPAGSDWHHALLAEAARPLPGVRPAIVSPTTLGDWTELLRFRHFLRHAYSADFDRVRLDALAARVRGLHPLARADATRLRERLAQAIAEAER